MSSTETEIPTLEPTLRGSEIVAQFFGPNSQPSTLFRDVRREVWRQEETGELDRITAHEWRPGQLR